MNDSVELAIGPALKWFGIVANWSVENATTFMLVFAAFAVLDMIVLAANGFKTSKYTPISNLVVKGTDKFCWMFWVSLLGSMSAGFIFATSIFVLSMLCFTVLAFVGIVISLLHWLVVTHWYITVPIVLVVGLIYYFTANPVKVSIVKTTYSKIKGTKPAQGIKNLHSVYKDKWCPVVEEGNKSNDGNSRD